MTCPKCQGTCALEQHNDLGNGVYVYRCLICGWAKSFVAKTATTRPIVMTPQERSNHYNRKRASVPHYRRMKGGVR